MSNLLMRLQITNQLDGYMHLKLCGGYLVLIYLMSPAVVSLQLHTKDDQLVTYNNTDDLSKFINKDFVHRTMLT